jgi:hypothetical protein
MTIVHTITAETVVAINKLICADGKVTKDEMITWFDRHKFKTAH